MILHIRANLLNFLWHDALTKLQHASLTIMYCLSVIAAVVLLSPLTWKQCIISIRQSLILCLLINQENQQTYDQKSSSHNHSDCIFQWFLFRTQSYNLSAVFYVICNKLRNQTEYFQLCYSLHQGQPTWGPTLGRMQPPDPLYFN